MKITNNSNIPLSLAVWAVNSDYDYIQEPNYISATSLLKPIRSIVLSQRLTNEDEETDLEDFVSAALGTAIHSGIEAAWKNNYKQNLKALGYSESFINKIQINPEKPNPEGTDIYIEKRNVKNFNDMKIGGKFDMVFNGVLQDNKSTSAYTYMYGTHDEDYKLQGSIYKWLNQDIIKEDFIRINFIFTDWNRVQAKSNPDYPQSRLVSKDIPLYTIEEIEKWIKHKTDQIKKYQTTEEKDLPECTDEELWRGETKYKYFSDPTKISGRSTKNFTSLDEAEKYRLEKGKGVVIIVPGEVRRCQYCKAYSVCSQRKRYFPDD